MTSSTSKRQSGGVQSVATTKSAPRRANVRGHGIGTEVQMHAERTSRRRRGASGLGRTQKLVLRLLASDAKSVRDLAFDWPTLTESSTRNAVNRLGDRGLVDVAGWDIHNGRTYCLTERGSVVEAGLNVDLDEESDDV